MTRPTPKDVKAMAHVADVPADDEVANRIATSIGPNQRAKPRPPLTKSMFVNSRYSTNAWLTNEMIGASTVLHQWTSVPWFCQK